MNYDLITSETKQANFIRLEGDLAARCAKLTAGPINLTIELASCGLGKSIQSYTEYRSGLSDSPVFIDPGLVEQIRPFMESAVRITFTGSGDPLSHPDFAAIMETCLSGGAELSFSTSGAMLRPEVSKKMVEFGLTLIYFSILSVSPENYRVLNRGRSLDDALSNLKELSIIRNALGANKPIIAVKTALMDRNIDEIEDLVRVASENGADQIIFEPFFPSQDDLEIQEFCRREKISMKAMNEGVERAIFAGKTFGIPVISPTLDFYRKLGDKSEEAWEFCFAPLNTGEAVPIYSPKGPICYKIPEGQSIACTLPWTTLHLNINGDVTPCRDCLSTVGALTVVTDPFDIWNGEDFQKLRKNFVDNSPPDGCLLCMGKDREKDIVEEFARVVLPTECLPEPETKPEKARKPAPQGLVLGLGFSPQGTSIALLGKDDEMVLRRMETLTGIVPSRFISRTSSPAARGEFFIEDMIFQDQVSTILEEGGGFTREDIKCLAYNPSFAIASGLEEGRSPFLEKEFPNATPVLVSPHEGQMALAFYSSPFDESAILVVDNGGCGVGIGTGEKNDLKRLAGFQPTFNPCALLTATRLYLGISAWEQGKITELATTGTDRFCADFMKEIEGSDELGFSFRNDGFLAAISEKTKNKSNDPAEILEEFFGPRRAHGRPILQHHLDIAKAVQKSLDEIIILLAGHTHKEIGLDCLCLEGWTGFNETLRKRILDRTPFTKLHVPPVWVGLGLGSGNALYASVLRQGEERPNSAAVRTALSKQGLKLHEPEELERFGKIALSTLRQQHKKMVNSFLKERNENPSPDVSAAYKLLSLQNLNLLSQRNVEREEIKGLKAYIENLKNQISDLNDQNDKAVDDKNKGA